ncbi:MAG TPA: YgiQ family radical SAM protein [Kofleriaceae bacterium]|nr:YgiQ family radical SAM protein [Kofleriaceae bacterium]
MTAPRGLFSYRPYWAQRFGIAPFLPTTRAEMDELGWDGCDVILVTGDAYIDHPSFGMALIGRLLEAHGFRVGILDQPDWRSPRRAGARDGASDDDPFRALGRPALFWGVTAGNMDSMVNRYTSDRRIRRDDAYSPDGAPGLRPDRAVTVYARRCREAFGDVPLVIGGIEASLRRIAHYDYWSDAVRRSVLIDAGADLLVYGNAERAIVEIAHRLAAGAAIGDIRDVRGTAFATTGAGRAGFVEIDSTAIDRPGRIERPPDPYAMAEERQAAPCSTGDAATPERLDRLVQLSPRKVDRATQVIRMPSFEQVSADPALYAHASRILHLESNPGNARALVQRHGWPEDPGARAGEDPAGAGPRDATRGGVNGPALPGQRGRERPLGIDVWIQPPPLPLTTPEMDALYELPFARVPHPRHQATKLPAYEMIKFSVTILRGCFGGCSFCSITEHEGRVIQSRSEPSILAEIARIRDATPGFHGVISDLGGPTANMYRMACRSRDIEAACRKPSCVYPDICDNLGTDHAPLVALYRKARAIPGVKRVFIASGVRYDLAVRSPEWIRELAQHHTGGYLKIAPEHTEDGPLAHMMKPGIGAYDRFKQLFDRYSQEAGKEQYLIPYFIAAHPGTTDEDMLQLALWLKRNGFRPDQVQAFLPSPMASATAMYHTGLSPLRSLKARQPVHVVKSVAQRRLHKAFLRYHDAENWPMLREALRRMGRTDLIGSGKHQLVPSWQPAGTGGRREGRRGPRPGVALTQHTGLPPMPHRKRR